MATTKFYFLQNAREYRANANKNRSNKTEELYRIFQSPNDDPYNIFINREMKVFGAVNSNVRQNATIPTLQHEVDWESQSYMRQTGKSVL